MNMLNLSDAWIEGWGITLLHSVWQGAVWSVALLISLHFLRKSPLRYAAGMIALGGFLVSVVWTAVLILPQQTSQGTSGMVTGLAFTLPAADQTTASTFFSGLLSLLPWFINFWLLGMILFIVRMIAGMHYLHRIERLGNPEIPEGWSRMVDQIAGDFRIRRPLKVVHSLHVDMPMVYGYFKPVLFLPVSYMSGLSPEQLEAIFAHELAHIRRHDFLVNFIQRIVEAIFFFNPFVWWISRSINAERERCCDDMAVNYCSDRKTYVKALSELEFYRSAHASMAMGLATDKSDLLHRIRRLIEPDYRQGGQYRLVLLAVLFTFVWFGFSMIDTSQDDGVAGEGDKADQVSVLEANILGSDRNVAPQLALDTLPPREFISPSELKKIEESISKIQLPELTEIAIPEIDTVELGRQLDLAFSAMEDMDFDIDMNVALKSIEDIDMDIIMDNVISGLEKIDFNFDLDTNIVLSDSVINRLSREEREELRRAREELRRAQRELSLEHRQEIQKLREEMMKQREEQREEWQKVREELQKEMEEISSLSPEEREKIRAEMSEAQKQIAEEMARAQQEMEEMRQVQEFQIQQEMKEAQFQLQQAQRELEMQMVEMEQHKVFLNRIEDQLRQDGYLEGGETLKTLKISEEEVVFNNRKVLKEDLDNYRKIYKEFFGEDINGKYEYRE